MTGIEKIPDTPGVIFIRRLERVPPFAAWLAMALGSAGILGWHLNLPALIRILPGHSPIQYNAAIALVCCGFALGYLKSNSGFLRAGALFAAVVTLLLGAVSWSEYQFNLDLGIDRIFFVPYDIDGISSNGRMAPNAALCFGLLGFVAMFMRISDKYWKQSLLLSLLPTVSFGVGALALFGYLSGVVPAYSWGPVTRLALPLAIGIPLLSFSQLVQIWDLGVGVANKRAPLVAFPVTVGLLIVSVGFAKILETQLENSGLMLPSLIVGIALSCFMGALIYFAQAVMTSHERMTRMYKTLAKQTVALERTNKELERFAYISAHDLQEPLRTIGGFTQVLETKHGHQLDLKGLDYLKKIKEGVRHLNELLADVMTYTSLSKARLHRESVILDALFDRLRAEYAARFEKQGAVLECSPLPVLFGNAVLFNKVFTALIDNALKFRSEAPPTIAIAAEKTNSQWVFTVRDNGIGIDPKYHDQIFEMFKRLQGRHVHDGTGLGLAIVKKVIESYGGTIKVSSALGEGATFIFTIPENLDVQSADSTSM